MALLHYLFFFALLFVASCEKGGAQCKYDIQCGIPAANLVQMRENTKSLSGKCTNFTCTCDSNYSCNRCHGQLLDNGDGVYSTYRKYTTTDQRSIDICTLPWGGDQCYMDSQCYNGLCIGGQCVCYYNWACGDCSLGLNEDILRGATCGQYVSGRGKCTKDTDCNHGVCQNGKCHCEGSYVCAHCNLKNDDVIGGLTCPCDDIDCGEHGTCENGKCVCKDGYFGIWCETNPCQLSNCGEHGRCDVNNVGVCICDAGWFGSRCDMQLTGGHECLSDDDCNGGVGGFCNQSNGYCECYDGWTCPQCNTKGTTCNEEARTQGGGPCERDSDCGNFGPDFNNPTITGGQCIHHQCSCYVGYTCPDCSTIGTSAEVVNGKKKCIKKVNGSFASSISLSIGLILVFVFFLF